MEIDMRLALSALAFAALGPMICYAGEQRCADHKQFVEFLRRTHGEYPVGRGLSHGGPVIEIFANGAGSWTIIWSPPTGKSCLVASGDGWEQSKNELAANEPLPEKWTAPPSVR